MAEDNKTAGFSSYGRSARRLPIRGPGYRQPKIVAQRRTGIFLLEQTTALEFRHQQPTTSSYVPGMFDAASTNPSQAGAVNHSSI
jgi:hypothetical protein